MPAWRRSGSLPGELRLPSFDERLDALLHVLRRVDDVLGASLTATYEEAVEGEARAQHIVYTTKDMQEGIQSFIERREPNFTGQ